MGCLPRLMSPSAQSRLVLRRQLSNGHDSNSSSSFSNHGSCSGSWYFVVVDAVTVAGNGRKSEQRERTGKKGKEKKNQRRNGYKNRIIVNGEQKKERHK